MSRSRAGACLAVFALTLAACGGSSGPAAGPVEKPGWAFSGASTGDCWSVDVAVHADGTFAVAGGYYGTNVLAPGSASETSLPGADSSDIFVARVTPLGELQWARSIVGMDYTDARSIATAADGSLYVCGYFFDTATFALGEPEEVTLVTADGEDGFLARYDGDGRLLWARQIASASIDELHGVTVLPDGAVVAVGLFAAPLTLGAGETNETTLTPTGWIEALTACYEADGTLRWARSTSTAGYGGAWGTTVLADGSIAVCGDYTGAMTFGVGELNETTTASVGGSSDVFVARYDADGMLLWVRSEGGADADYAAAVSPAPDSGLRFTGMFAAQATFGASGPAPRILTSAGSHDGFCASYDAAGALVWVSQMAGQDHDEALRARVLADGTTVVIGGFVGTTTVGEGQVNEAVLLAADPLDREVVFTHHAADGTLLRASALGGSGDDTAVGCLPMPDGTYVIVGSFMEELVLANDPLLVGEPTKACAYVMRVDLTEGD